jgi:hypothetical protein
MRRSRVPYDSDRIVCKQKAKVNTAFALRVLGYTAHFGWKALPHESASFHANPRNCRPTFSAKKIAA